MTLFEELGFVLGVGTNGLREVGGNGMEKVEVNQGVALKLPTDDGVIQPLDLDEVGDALGPVFFGDLQRIISCASIHLVSFWWCWEAMLRLS